MFQPDPKQWPIQLFPDVIPPQFRGGVAPSRYDVALSDYVEKQQARRQASFAEHAGSKLMTHLWSVLFQAGRGLFGAILHLGLGRSGIGRLRGEVR